MKTVLIDAPAYRLELETNQNRMGTLVSLTTSTGREAPRTVLFTLDDTSLRRLIAGLNEALLPKAAHPGLVLETGEFVPASQLNGLDENGCDRN